MDYTVYKQACTPTKKPEKGSPIRMTSNLYKLAKTLISFSFFSFSKEIKPGRNAMKKIK